MTAFIFALTLRQIVGRKSILLLLVLNSLPVLVAVVFRLSDPNVDAERWTAALLRMLVVTTILPLTTLLLATSVIGDELEDGTVVYLLTKPLQRWQILVPKLLAAWLTASVLLCLSTVTTGVLALGGNSSGIVSGFAVAVAAGALAYSSVFIYLSVATNRALITGLIYVFVWEGVITSLFDGTRYLSVRHITFSIAEAVGDIPVTVFDAYVAGSTAIVIFLVATITAVFLAKRRLEEVEVREPS